jgi:hypothetical protein
MSSLDALSARRWVQADGELLLTNGVDRQLPSPARADS